jgi:hypothetical protein
MQKSKVGVIRWIVFLRCYIRGSGKTTVSNYLDLNIAPYAKIQGWCDTLGCVSALPYTRLREDDRIQFFGREKIQKNLRQVWSAQENICFFEKISTGLRE